MPFNFAQRVYDALVFGTRVGTGSFGRGLNPANYPDDLPLKKDPDILANWPSIPWDDPNVQAQIKRSEWSKAFISNIVLLGKKINHTNMCLEMPGRLMNPSGLSRKPSKQWNPDPISKEEFKNGKMALLLTFNNSPRLRVDIGSPYNRGFFIGTSMNVHMGGTRWFFNHTLDYTSLEERVLWIHGSSTTHYSCKRSKIFKPIIKPPNTTPRITVTSSISVGASTATSSPEEWGKNNFLSAVTGTQYEKEIKELIDSLGDKECGHREQSWPVDIPGTTCDPKFGSYPSLKALNSLNCKGLLGFGIITQWVNINAGKKEPLPISKKVRINPEWWIH